MNGRRLAVIFQFTLHRPQFIQITEKMKKVVLLFLVLFCSIISTNARHGTNEAETKISPTSTSALKTTSPATTIPTLEENLVDTSVQDITSSDKDANDKIEEKIINAFTEFSSNCNVYKRMELSLKNFTFSKKSINIDLGGGINASFYKIAVREFDGKLRSYSTLIRCDLSRKAKVEVTLPRYIVIFANIKIIEETDSLNGLESQVVNEGFFSMSLRNNSISKQYFFQMNNSNYEDNTKRKISYSNSEVYLDNIDTKYQKLIYSNLEEILNEVELSVERFFVDQLSAQLSKNNIAVGQSCSKFLNMEKNSKKINSLSLNNDFHDLYAIQNVSLESWEGVSSSAGPIVIKGISHFNSIELSILGTEMASPGDNGLFYSTPRYEDPEKKEMTVRIKTDGLKGKLDWSYNSKQRSFPFLIDFILFEMKKNKTSKFTTVYLPRKNYNKWYSRTEDDRMDIDVFLGNIEIKSPSFCEDEKEFVNLALSKHLKTIISDSLRNSMAEKLQNNSSVAKCL